jgi:hypothetical protein
MSINALLSCKGFGSVPNLKYIVGLRFCVRVCMHLWVVLVNLRCGPCAFGISVCAGSKIPSSSQSSLTALDRRLADTLAAGFHTQQQQ